MGALHAFLSGLLGVPGVEGAALIDAVTGLVFASAGDTSAWGVESEPLEFATLITDRLGRAGHGGEMDSVIVTSTRHYQVLHVLRGPGDPLLLAASLSRERANLALATRQLTTPAREVFA